MRILIIEDEKPAQKRLTQLLESILPKLTIVGVVDSVESGREWFEMTRMLPDLIFSDIRLADGLCFSLFEELDNKAPIIFTTAYDQYAIKAFQYHGIAYLLKPIRAEELETSVSKYREMMLPNADHLKELKNLLSGSRKTYKNQFIVHYRDHIKVIKVSEIAYFYYDSGELYLVKYSNERYLLNESIEYLSEQLDPTQFFRANRQYILSVDVISEVYHDQNQKLLVKFKINDEEICISRQKAMEFKRWLAI